MTVTYRLALSGDLPQLFELRRRAIIFLAPNGMNVSDAETWAFGLTLDGMGKKFRELEIWVAELDDEIVGWGAIRANRLEGLYTDPSYSGRGIGTALLRMLEELIHARGNLEIRTTASQNAEDFYHRRGYERIGPHDPIRGTLMCRRLAN